MRRFQISVNGTPYDVAVEELGVDAQAPAPAPAAAPVAAPAPAAAPDPAPAAKPAATVGTKVLSPMPGTIMNVNVAVGDTVKEGQVVMVLEAMKMENDIVAVCDGKISAIMVKKGDNVDSNDVLLTIQ